MSAAGLGKDDGHAPPNSTGASWRHKLHEIIFEADTPVGKAFDVILLIAIWLFFLRQMQSGGNRAFSFGKSKAKLINADRPQVTFADVAGAEEAKSGR